MNDKEIIALPTGTCFDDALYILLEFQTSDAGIPKNLKIVHGLCNITGKPSAHAWVEVEDGCIFKAIIDNETVTLMASPHKDYYKKIKLLECKKYTPKHFFKLYMQNDYPGPWIEKYLMYCSDQKNSGMGCKERVPFPNILHRGGVT